MPKTWRVAAIQMNSTDDPARNRRSALRLVRRAAAEGARLVALPENFALLRPEGRPVTLREPLDGPLVTGWREEAARLGCRILLGSVPEARRGARRIHNTSVLIGPDGSLEAVYRKMHLFDIAIRGGVTLRESRTVEPGAEPVVASTPLGRLGLTICYDVRFPEQYRAMTLAGMDVVFVPAAFTAYTGPHHWLPLLRARAIENQCWVVAPAQVGDHGSGRRSHGETVVIDPWGEVVARRLRGVGIVAAEIDLKRVADVRRGLPCLDHVRRELHPRRPAC